jgi:Fe2+-dicitrate sensor, membrane component
MSEKRIHQLISRKLAGEATFKELEELQEYLNANPDKKQYYDLFMTSSPIEKDSLSKAEQLYAVHQLKMHIYRPETIEIIKHDTKKNFLIKLQPVIWWAASILIIIISGVVFFNTTVFQDERIEIAATKGSKSNIKLPDGTIVWLNSDSKIYYRNDFSTKGREVWLSGEAFFDVRHDPANPFVIHTTKINIKVLGTAFNVKSYPNDSYTATSLIRGKIDVNFTDRPEEHIILRPNEKLTVSKAPESGSDRLTLEKTNKPKISLEAMQNHPKGYPAETAWMENKLIFNDSPLSDIAKVLERKFDIEIIFSNDNIGTYRFTGIFENENIQEILKLIQITKPFKYELNKKQLTIY